MATKAAAPSSWHLVYDEFKHKHWRAYAGNWYLFAKGRPEPMTLKGLRSFRFHDETRMALTHRNIYNTPGVLTPFKREADGLWEQSWERVPNDISYTTNFILSESERTKPDARPVRRLVPLTPDAYIGAVPLQPTPEWAPAQWAIELFLRGGDGTRWSFGAVYPAAGPTRYSLAMQFLIQEQWVGEVPDSPIDLDKIQFLETRPGKLPDNPSDWLQGASAVTGTRCSAHVGADTADLSAVNEQPLSEWAAPAIPQGHELLLLPDEMYPVVPSTLPFGADTDAGGAGSEGELVFEFGGRMRGARGLRRVRAVYPPGGVASGFEFDVLQMA